jgi:hypothetical protein
MLGRARLQAFLDHGLTLVRQDLQTDQGWVPDIEGVLSESSIWEGRTLFICGPNTIRFAPINGWVELRNEPDFKMIPTEYARDLEFIKPWVLGRGLQLWAGSISNLDKDSLDWLQEVIRLCPWIERVAIHRYTPGKHQNPNDSHKGFKTRADEVKRLRSIIGSRPFLVTEVGYHTAPYTTGWWLWKQKHRLTVEQQRDRLLQELHFWKDHGAEGVVIFQEQDGTGMDQYGLRWGNIGPWKTPQNYAIV